MAKMPKPLPVTVVKFDQHGVEVHKEVVTPLPDYKKRMMGMPVPKKDEWMPDEIKCTMRIMGRQKKGGTTVLGYAHKWNVAEKIAQFDKRVDLDLVYTEDLPPDAEDEEAKAIKELHDRRMAELYPKANNTGSNASGATMTDEHARRVKFGDLANVKTSVAARTLGLTYGQVYSARNGYTFKHVTK